MEGDDNDTAGPKKTARVLVVDDEATIRELCVSLLKREGYRVEAVATAEAALERMAGPPHLDVLMADVRLPKMDGLDLLRMVRERYPSIQVVVFTAHGSIEHAVKAIRMGAIDYLTKPFTKGKLFSALAHAARVGALEKEVGRLREELQTRFRFDNIVGNSPEMQEVFRMMGMACRSDNTVLILGESGTGKELVARAIHYNSRRASGPFVPVNCAALPKGLIEGELFGHVRGAFTGAVSDSVGLFRAAQGGTIFLDEVSEMPLEAQAKLLRTLQEHNVRPVGGTREVPVDVRVLAASNQQLQETIAQKQFRADLYYRICVITITIAPLRERRGDIPALAEYFLNIFNRGSRRKVEGFEPDFMEALGRYDWPGNAREVENAIASAFALGHTARLRKQDLPHHVLEAVDAKSRSAELWFPGSAVPTMLQAERELVRRAMEVAQGNKSHAAKMLGITRKRLYHKLEKHELAEPTTTGERAAP